jgi:hypothetical protein
MLAAGRAFTGKSTVEYTVGVGVGYGVCVMKIETRANALTTRIPHHPVHLWFSRYPTYN